MEKIRIKAYGKINIGLDVLRKRSDGYHEVKMVMQTVGIYDCVEIEKIANKEIKVSTNLPYVPDNENNLAYKAAKMLKDEFQILEGVKIKIQKKIPVSGGMAGGSADAAAVLLGMNRIFSLGLSQQELQQRGVFLGADVPYCIQGGTCLAEGVGEKLTQISPMPNCYVLVAKPGFSVSTARVYNNLNLNDIIEHPDIEGIIQGINDNDLIKIADKMGNVLETVTVREHKEIELIKEMMVQEGAMSSLMSGSGPTVFGLFGSKETLEKAYGVLKKEKIIQTLLTTKIVNVGGDIIERV